MSGCPDGMIPGPGGAGCVNAPAKYARGGVTNRKNTRRGVKKYPHGGVHTTSRPLRRKRRPRPLPGNGNPYGPGMKRGGRVPQRGRRVVKGGARKMRRGGRFARPVVARRGRRR